MCVNCWHFFSLAKIPMLIMSIEKLKMFVSKFIGISQLVAEQSLSSSIGTINIYFNKQNLAKLFMFELSISLNRHFQEVSRSFVPFPLCVYLLEWMQMLNSNAALCTLKINAVYNMHACSIYWNNSLSNLLPFSSSRLFEPFHVIFIWSMNVLKHLVGLWPVITSVCVCVFFCKDFVT